MYSIKSKITEEIIVDENLLLFLQSYVYRYVSFHAKITKKPCQIILLGLGREHSCEIAKQGSSLFVSFPKSSSCWINQEK